MSKDIIDDNKLPEDFFKKARPAREVLEEDFGKKNAERIIKRKLGRPVASTQKQQITLRIDSDILKKLRSYGKGWQTNINHILRVWVEKS